MTAEPKSARVLLAVDIVLLALCQLVALSPLADAYAGTRWLVAAVAGIALALAATQLARRFAWGPLRTVSWLAAGYLLVAPLIGAAAVGRELITGVVDSWRTALTMPTPLANDFGVLIVPLLMALIGTAIAATYLWRSRWPGLAALAVLATFVAAAAFGIRAAEFSFARGALLVVLLLVWTRWRAMREIRSSWRRRAVLSAAVVAAAGLVASGLTLVSADATARVVARDHVDPPLQELDFMSPLSRFRDFYKNTNLKDARLFTISGGPADARVVLAMMDTFDGLVWNVSTTDRSTGTSAFVRAPAAEHSDAVKVAIDALTGPWVPTVGLATGATYAGDDHNRLLLFNRATGGVAEYGNLKTGDTFTVDWAPRDTSTPDADASADPLLPRPTLPVHIAALDKLVQGWLARDGASSDYQRAATIARHFHDEGYFSNGLEDQGQVNSPSGHSAKRIADMVEDPERMVGNAEQYASAMAIALQTLGLPTRVVLGFEKLAADGSVVGSDISAWVEVKFAGSGWVPFLPTPPKDHDKPPALHDTPNPAPQPNVVQPPLVPQEPAAIQGTAPEGAGKSLGGKIWEVIVMIVHAVMQVVRVLLWITPLWLILGFKWWRRRRRRSAADPIDRVSGAWREATDGARDLGARLPEGFTRAENSTVLAQRFPASGVSALAAVADRHVFGPGVPSDEEVAAYWADVDTALARMRGEAPRWRRWLAWISPMSIPWGLARRTAIGQAGRLREIRLDDVRREASRLRDQIPIPNVRRKAE